MNNLITLSNSDVYLVSERLLASLSDTSKRQYLHTFEQWQLYCDTQGIHVSMMTVENVKGFLASLDVAYSTRKTRLSHLRNLIKHLFAAYPDNRAIESLYRQLDLYRPKRPDSEKLELDRKNALTMKQVEQVFNVYPESTLLHIRNRAMLACLFGTGVRRVELTRLQRRHVDTEQQLLTVLHGKRDKDRTIPITYHWQHILKWYEQAVGRDYLFCSVRKGDNFGSDMPTSTQTVYRVVKHVGDEMDIQHLSPHDARRTIITDLLDKGVSVADVQYIAGHENPETTLGYKVRPDAIQVRNRVRRIIEKPLN